MTILVFGRGFLGQRLGRDLPDALVHGADIADEAAVRAALEEHRPSAVVNAAGKTGRPNVDWCEAHQAETYRSNVEGPLVLARVCAEAGVYLVHLGSGCIFNGASPSPGGWREDDVANPVSHYARTKHAADRALSAMPKIGIARLRMPIDDAPGPRNLITKLASYEAVIDVENSVTFVEDFVAVIAALVRRRAEGIFHATNPGTLRHRDLLMAYREIVDPSHEYELIREDELVARRLVRAPRSTCILANTRLSTLGIEMRPVGIALRDAMTRYAKAV